MQRLINSSFNRTYNPGNRKNTLTDIKRLLTTRDTVAQLKACEYLIETYNRCNKDSNEISQLVEYLLDNDITVFLCEATSNLDFSVFRSVLSCLRLLLHDRRFFAEDRAAHVMAMVSRALAHYTGTKSYVAVHDCLNFLCDLLKGISTHETVPALSNQSAYSTEQLLACLNALIQHFNTNRKVILSSALVLHALISYQPDDFSMKGSTTKDLVSVLSTSLNLLLNTLNLSMLVESANRVPGYKVICQLGFDSLRLAKSLHKDKSKATFVQTILTDDQEINIIQESVIELENLIQHVLMELAVFTKENQQQIDTEEYRTFLTFLLQFLYDCSTTESLSNFCDMLYSKGYLRMLPQIQMNRDNALVRKASTLVLGEILKVLTGKYLINTNNMYTSDGAYAIDINMGLVQLECGMEKPEIIGPQFQKSHPYSLLIYIYFYCQSHENPHEATAHLLPYLIEYILGLPESFRPPPYIIKALWLVYAMSSISNNTLNSLDERINLEKSTDRLIAMLHPEPSIYYTHNPAILLWAFTTQRIIDSIRINILSQWFSTEDFLPGELMEQPMIWTLFLDVVTQNKLQVIKDNCMKALGMCLDKADVDTRNEFSLRVWSTLPRMLSAFLADEHDVDNETESSICCILNLATTLLPQELDQTTCVRVAILLVNLFVKYSAHLNDNMKFKYYSQFLCLKLCIYLLGQSINQNDNTVLLVYTNNASFLQSVLSAKDSLDEQVACTALQLLSCIVRHFSLYNYQPKSILQVQTHSIAKLLRQDSTSDRVASLLQLVCTILDSGLSTPLALSHNLEVEPTLTQQYLTLRSLMFRILMTCCVVSPTTQTSAGWRTLSSIFKHVILTKTDPELIATLVTRTWTDIFIYFQVTQSITLEFLIFLLKWLSLYRITIKKSKELTKLRLSKQSILYTTVTLIKMNLVSEDDDLMEMIPKILIVIKQILEDFNM